MGRILGLLLVTEGARSAEEIATTLKVSLGSISTNMKFLITAGLIDKKSVPGDRLSYYAYATNAVEKDIISHMERLLVMKSISAKGLKVVRSQGPASQRLKEIIESIDLYNAMLEKLIKK